MTSDNKEVKDDIQVDQSLLDPLREKILALNSDKNDKREQFEDSEVEAIAKDDVAMGRFLVARNNKLEKAYDMAKATIQWRSEVQPAKITTQDFPTAHPQGVWRFAGKAKNGWGIILVTAAFWKSFSYSVDEYIKMVTFHVEQTLIRHTSETDGSKVFIMFDMANMSYIADIRKLRSLTQVLNDYYPERLGQAVFVNCDWVFDKFFNICIKWVDKRTAERCVDFRGNGAEFLLEHVDADQLETKYGGTREEEWPLEPL